MNETDAIQSDDARLDACEQILDYRFQERSLLRRALTHSSISATRMESNERLEFLGDAVLGFVVCETLFERYPEFPEGELTRIKSALVSRVTCAKICRRLGLQRCLFLGKGLTTGGARIPSSVIAASVESLIAAMYLDGGIDVAREFIQRTLEDDIVRLAESEIEENYKSLLQHLSQRDFQRTPVYEVVDEKGPDHSKCFQVAARIGDHQYPPAWGNTKKQAEQRAAQNALIEIAPAAESAEEQPPAI